MSSAGDAMDRVISREDSITLATYRLLGENPNPVFRSQYGVAHIYPYTLLDDIASSPAAVRYRALILENRYLKVTVIPDLGGRVYSVYDKLTGREVFYKNPVVKFSPLAIRGAFFSGGVEFSFPVAHAPTTADPVNWAILNREDGSASIAIGGLEHMAGMRWTITLTLFPGRCALAQDVWLYNPSPVPGRYHYWTNASLDSDDRTEFIYPLRRVRSYEFAGTSSWPVARLDLITSEPGLPGMEGVPMWPAARMHAPFDFRWENNMLAQVSIFGRDVAWDFFGAWHHSSDTGYAHFAHHTDVSGMKLWSWGQSEVGIVNQTALMDDGSLYAETQCGAMETQLDFDFMPPGRIRRWREWWLPLRGLGGLTCASETVGALLRLEAAASGMVNLTVGLCPAIDLRGSMARLSIPGRTLFEKAVEAAPDRPWLHTKKIPAHTLAGHPITLRVTDAAGTLVLDYTHERTPSPVGTSESQHAAGPQTAEDFYRLGLRHENFDNRADAFRAYQTAVDLSPDHAAAHLQLGLMHLRAADFDRAGAHLRQAASLGLAEASYYRGLIAWHSGEAGQATEHFRAVPPGLSVSDAALRGLGYLALARGIWQQAIDAFQQAVSASHAPHSAHLALALAFRKAGKVEEAHRQLEIVLAADPLNHLALHEMVVLTGSAEHKERLHRMLADDPQYWLDLAGHYADAGLLRDALDVLEAALRHSDSIMAAYLAGYFCHRLAEPDAAAAWLARAQAGRVDRLFPSRLWEVVALEHAIEHNPADCKAKYALGNFMYAQLRREEAIRLWQEATASLDDFDVLHRNLGLACWQAQDDPDGAIAHFEKALALNPYNQDLYLLLDDLYKAGQMAQRRQDLLERIQALEHTREDVRKRMVTMMLELGQLEEIIHILETEQFVPLEMDQSFHWVHARAYMQRAASHQAAGRLAEAIADYRKALEFPENHGVGRPTTMTSAEILYRLGCALEEAGRFEEALAAWGEAASEHHPFGHALYEFVQMSLDKLSRYSEIGFHG
jgi:tetratricopeptide (TPR) repeat protein